MRSNTAMLALASLALAAIPAAADAQWMVRQFEAHDPGRCAVAARVVDGVNRHDRRDTAIYSPARDTLYSATRQSVRDCARAFGGSTADDRETLNLARVQLFTLADEAAIASARTRLAKVASRSPEERAWELYLVITDNLGAHPARIEQARLGLAELDALGKPASGVRTLAHLAMANAAIARYDDALMRTETEAVVTAWKELDAESRLYRATALASALVGRANAEVLASGAEAARAVLDTALGLVPPAVPMARGMVTMAQQTISNVGKPARKLDARFWYNVGTTGAARPAPGRVSLIVPAYRPCSAGCLSMLDGIRRILRQFGEQELDVTFRTRTYGFYLDTAPATPAAEALYDSTYLLGEVRLPGALAIAETKFSWKADGRRVNEATPDDVAHPAAALLIVDRRGVVRYAATGWNPIFEARITELIGRALKEPGS